MLRVDKFVVAGNWEIISCHIFKFANFEEAYKWYIIGWWTYEMVKNDHIWCFWTFEIWFNSVDLSFILLCCDWMIEVQLGACFLQLLHVYQILSNIFQTIFQRKS